MHPLKHSRFLKIALVILKLFCIIEKCYQLKTGGNHEKVYNRHRLCSFIIICM